MARDPGSGTWKPLPALGLKELGEGRRREPSPPRAASWAAIGANRDDACILMFGSGHRPQCPPGEFHTRGDRRKREVRAKEDLTHAGAQGPRVSRP